MKKRVLLVDDNYNLSEELNGIFEENNIELLSVEDGKSAIAVAEKEPYDVAVVDIRLPDYNGVELLDELKKRCPKAVNLIITAYASTETAIRALHKEIFDYIVKPFSPEELMVSVKKALLIKDSDTASESLVEDLMKERSILKAKVLMLEQMNDLFMDRETKIMQLKKEINGLTAKLREKPRYIL